MEKIVIRWTQIWLAVAVLIALFATAGRSLAQSEDTTSQNEANSIEINDAILMIVDSRSISSQVSGMIMDLNVTEGDLVIRDEVIAKIDDREIMLELDEARIEASIALERTNSNVEVEFSEKARLVAEADYQRAIESNRQFAGVVSQTEMDRLRLVVEKNEAELKKILFDKKLLELNSQLANAKVRRKEFELERLRVHAQMDGKVVEINKRQGEWVQTGEPFFKIVRLDKLRVENYVPAELATNDLLGAKATFAFGVDTDTQNYNAQVVFIDPNVNPLNSQTRIWVEVENPNLVLRPGMKGHLNIELPK